MATSERREQLTTLTYYFPSLGEHCAKEDAVFDQISDGLNEIGLGNLSWARLDQIMHSCSQSGMSEGFYRYYFLEAPRSHPYPVQKVMETDYELIEGIQQIKSFRQLEWGLRRFFYDAMLYWGSFRQAYQELRQRSYKEIEAFFTRYSFDTRLLISRGNIKGPHEIDSRQRHLISEAACKTLGCASSVETTIHGNLALRAFRALKENKDRVESDELLEAMQELANAAELKLLPLLYKESPKGFECEKDVITVYERQMRDFHAARDIALKNTKTYLSFCNDLDVYVATSMRVPQDFEYTATVCKEIFRANELAEYDLRYFDPTLSAAEHHEDKGIIECLMVKTAKIALYFAQDRESLGKVSEYAMASCLGKPVIILCPDTDDGKAAAEFYRDAHPLTRLVEFASGVVHGAMITCDKQAVIELLRDILSNSLEYDLAKKEGTDNYFLLQERRTRSTVRVITDDRLLTDTFWNNYHDMH